VDSRPATHFCDDVCGRRHVDIGRKLPVDVDHLVNAPANPAQAGYLIVAHRQDAIDVGRALEQLGKSGHHPQSRRPATAEFVQDGREKQFVTDPVATEVDQVACPAVLAPEA
jgi:hypothetical protein